MEIMLGGITLLGIHTYLSFSLLADDKKQASQPLAGDTCSGAPDLTQCHASGRDSRAVPGMERLVHLGGVVNGYRCDGKGQESLGSFDAATVFAAAKMGDGSNVPAAIC